MTQPILNLPTNIPWKQIAVSPDMMDTEFCNKKFPFAWRSSLAISAYEPKPDELPPELCGERITYLKITASITGYQPTAKDTMEIAKTGEILIKSFPSIPTENFKNALYRITDEYFACYGVLLNVAVFPYPSTKKVFPEQLRIKLAELEHAEPGMVLDNPFVHISGITFEATGEQNNRIVDRFPEGGEGQGELDLHKKLVITLPSPEEIEAVEVKIAHQSDSGVSMEAFNGDESLGTQSAGHEKGQVHKLYIEGKKIDKVVLTAPDNKASLLEFTTFEGPGEKKDIPLNDYPHIIDLEPKTRDLYQAATESGEFLTSSQSSIRTDKSLTATEQTETGFAVEIPIVDKNGNKIGGIAGNRNRTDTDQQTWAVQTDASRERRETEGSATQLSQMYNLLTSYHAGTNRSAHLMLARPHVLQPTDKRTFVQGLRAIEGMQEFFLIVSRPKDIEGLSIEASLETGHYPEDVDMEIPESDPHKCVTPWSRPIPWVRNNNSRSFLSDQAIAENFNESIAMFSANSDWEFDFDRKGGPIEERILEGDNADQPRHLRIYSLSAEEPNRINIFARLKSRKGSATIFHRKFRAHLRKPKETSGESKVDVGQLLITNRSLCTRFRSDEGCLEVLPVWQPPENIRDWRDWIVDEPHIRVDAGLLTREASRESRLPAIKQFQQQIRSAMTSSWRQPNRRALGEVGFLASDYFKDQIRKLILDDYLKTPVGKVSGLPKSIIKTFGKRSTISEILDLDITSLAKRTGLSIEESSKARHRLLSVGPELGESNKQEGHGDEKNTE